MLPTDPEPVVMRQVTWDVTEAGFCLSGDDYEAMSLNMAEILRWMKQKSDQVDLLVGQKWGKPQGR